MYLFKNNVKDRRFVEHAKEYGINMIKETVKTEECKEVTVELMARTFTRDPRIKSQAAVEVLKYFVNHPETTKIAAAFSTNAALRDNVLAIIGK